MAHNQIRILSSNHIQIIGGSIQRVHDGLIADVDEKGVVNHWEFSGGFQPKFYFPYPRKPPQDEKQDHRESGRI